MSDVSGILDVVTVVGNPIRWQTRIDHAVASVESWLREPNVRVTLVECAYGARGYDLAAFAAKHQGRVIHVPVRARTLAWNKESCLNVGISRLPPDACYVGTFDADVVFRRPGWANEAIHALQLYPIVQPWSTAYDLGPNDEHMQVHRSFASLHSEGQPVVAGGSKFWKFDGGPYEYAHTGYAWCWTADILDKIGGLFEHALMGSGDHHMGHGIVGSIAASIPDFVSDSYRAMLNAWEGRVQAHAGGRLGYVPGTIEHFFHGKKASRQYNGRWQMFEKYAFDPITDVKRNRYGVLEFSGNNPDLEREWHAYLRARDEDVNSLL